ncbi:MAG: hypothetical protein J1F35_03110 [Erysipelotrichales bacterium]|nr:hypothetical protein [Erysipelotrichales bacterium]
MNTQVKLFDANNKLVPNFNEEIEKILISVHGEKYYDVDEELVNTNEIAIIQDEINTEIKKEVKEKGKSKKKGKVSVRDFIPVLFFLLIFIVIVIAGYYFLNTVDLMNLIGATN